MRFFRSLSLPNSSTVGLSTWLRTRLKLLGVATKVGLATIAFTGAVVVVELGVPTVG